MNNNIVTVRVQGDFACFTRPENKVERVSYPVMTPSAARGVLEAIYWHPQFRWAIREIQVLAEIKTFSLLRNEVNSKMSLSSEGFFADEDRTQRHAVCLRNVDYVIVAEPIAKPKTEPAAKHRDIFRKRVAKGQCFHRPALGTREFAAEFSPATDAPAPLADLNQDLGLMLWDMDFPERDEKNQPVGGSKLAPITPLFFAATLRAGVMRVPRYPIGRGE